MFHVPEKYRFTLAGHALSTTEEAGNNGVFLIPAGVLRPGRSMKKAGARVIASDGLGWEHVSVVRSAGPAPTWDDMCKVKALFWDPEDVVVQFHPRQSQHVNNHDACLHLWRPVGVELPTPTPEMVGIFYERRGFYT